MRATKRLSVALLLTAALTAAVIATRAQTSSEEVKLWLDRMNTSAEQLNYRGRYVHVSSGDAETLTIAHRYADGKVRERITAGGDAAREILRTNDQVLRVIPESRRVVVEHLQDAPLPWAGSLLYSEALDNVYAAKTLERGKVAGRNTQYISIEARDAYRYGYRFWLDRETALPLKSQVIGEAGQIVEQMIFTEIEFVDEIPEAEIMPAIGVDGFEWVRRVEAKPEATSDELWGATRLPDGFRLSVSRKSLLAGSTYPVHHLIYTDGLASISIFIADPRSEANNSDRLGLSRRGGVSMYAVKIDGRLVTAVGEVPPKTVQRIATSLDAR